MKKYNPSKIEKKWQKFWLENKEGFSKDFSKKKKLYLLVEFPYPSGDGLHVGHCRPYIAFDIIARKKRMEGYNVLFPMGWDAFGLPTENYSIKTGIHPKIATKKNTSFFKKQQISLGLSFDWSREINTTDPSYYKWTQWIFLQFFKHGLAYKKKMPINWCPSCKIGLANEEVIDGSCERCGNKVERKEKEQWLLKITDYADRLLNDLDLVDYPQKVKDLQKDWIGKSLGWLVKFKTTIGKDIEVFTTRIDTIFGATYLVLSPEHSFIREFKDKITNYNELEEYIKEAQSKTERERISAEDKEKTGVLIKGIKAINPANNQEIPIFVADYVLSSYGKGAIMAVPSHDQRDFNFAKKYNLPIIEVIKPQTGLATKDRAYEGEGVLVNSGIFNGIFSRDAKEKIGAWLKEKNLAQKAVYYKLRDWIFSRQRYWGEPIPLVFCLNCKKTIEDALEKNRRLENFNKGEILNPGWIALPEDSLPLKLPNVKDYKPTDEGDSPLAKAEKWIKVKCPKCSQWALRETDVMPNWAGSNWYFLRYCDPNNDKQLASPSKLKYWMPVDWYNGGMEHSTLHLLYSRFVYKFLWDIGAVPKELGSEPYKKRTSHGVILGPGGVKMSKSKGNVIRPEEVTKEYGADALRLYEMFMGPFSEKIAWDEKGIKGTRRFLEKTCDFLVEFIENNKRSVKKVSSVEDKDSLKSLEFVLNKTIKKISEDIDNLRLNTAVSSLMVLMREVINRKNVLKIKHVKTIILLLAPFAPHISQELWSILAKGSVHKQKWPIYDKKLIKESKVLIIIQVNGKVRGKMEVESFLTKEEIEKLALENEKVVKWLEGKKIKKVIFVPGRLINIVV
jgi:leucyl-tRNA synthetase